MTAAIEPRVTTISQVLPALPKSKRIARGQTSGSRQRPMGRQAHGTPQQIRKARRAYDSPLTCGTINADSLAAPGPKQQIQRIMPAILAHRA